MSTLQEDLNSIDTLEDKVVKNKVARFAYTEKAYNDNDADGVDTYDVNKEQNIPKGTASVMKVNETVLNKGYRAQASSITRMLMNHFLGRISYNLNKVNDVVSSFIKTVKSHLGSANGIATLDSNGRIPYTQLPESAMEFMGTWDASTNTPTLTDGTGVNGSFYVVSVAGTQTFGGVATSFNVNDRIIYDGKTSSWTKLSSGDVRTVNNIKPDKTGNVTLDAPDVNAVKTINNQSPDKKTGNINLEYLSINGQSFNGSASVSVDTMKMLYGGTGATNAKGAEFNITEDMKSQASDFTDTTKITCVQESPSVSNGRFFYSSASYLWNYIKDKISSVLGLTASNYGGTALNATNAEQATRATNDGNGNNIVNTYATKTALDNKANVVNTNYKTTKQFYGQRNGQYVKIGSIPVSASAVYYAALDIDVFSASPVSNFPVGSINLNMSSGSYATAFNINGYSSIPLNDLTDDYYPRIVVEKTSTDYILYVVSSYGYLSITVTEGHCTKYTRGNFEEVSALSGTVVYDSTVDNQIIPFSGALPVANGGTGKTTAKDAANAFINSLTTSTDVPVDDDYYVCQSAGGGTTTTTYHRRPVSKLWEYIKGKISQEGEEFAYDHIVHDEASLLVWANCTDGSMKKVLIKSGTYNMTKGVNLSNAGTGYVLAEQGAVIESHVPVAFEKTTNALCSIYNLEVVCCVSENSSYCTAFKDSYSSHVFKKYLVLYNCKAGYDTVKLCNNYLFLSCWCFNCIFNAVSNTTTGMSVKIFSDCYCTNCVCTLAIQGETLFEKSDFFNNSTCINCQGDIEINVDILNSDQAFCAFHYCCCIACDAVFTCATPSLSVQSPCYCFNGGSYMSSCYAFADYQSTSNRRISGIYDCSYISSTNSNNWGGLNSKVDADSCNNS